MTVQEKYIVTPKSSNYVPPFQSIKFKNNGKNVFNRPYLRTIEFKGLNGDVHYLLHQGTWTINHEHDDFKTKIDFEINGKLSRFFFNCSFTDLSKKFHLYKDSQDGRYLKTEEITNDELEEAFLISFGLNRDNEGTIRGEVVEHVSKLFTVVIVSYRQFNGNVLLVGEYENNYYINYAEYILLHKTGEVKSNDDVDVIASNCIDKLISLNS